MSGKIAIVIPAYRCENVIAETLDSVHAQQRKAEMVLVVLDVPNPRLEAICRAHEIKPEVIVNPRNLGLGATRNIGFRHIQNSDGACQRCSASCAENQAVTLTVLRPGNPTKIIDEHRPRYLRCQLPPNSWSSVSTPRTRT